jgi:hypothetical protein
VWAGARVSEDHHLSTMLLGEHASFLRLQASVNWRRSRMGDGTAGNFLKR